MSHQPKESKKKTQVSVMTGNKIIGKTRQGRAKASSYSDPSNSGPSISPQRQLKGKHATAPIGQFKKGRLEHESAQDEKAIATPNSFTGSDRQYKPWKAVGDGASFGGMKSISPNTTNRTSGSSTETLGPQPFLQPSDADVNYVPVKAKLLRRFYEPLVLLRVLDLSRGSHIPRSTGDVGCEEEELRRSFIDSVAYICDYEKGGDTVTAAAMQKEPAGVTIWLAANTTIQVKTFRFLHDVLECLAAITVSNRASTEDILAVRIIDFNKKRLQAYKSFVRPDLQECLKILDEVRSHLVSPEDRSQTSAWIEGFADLIHTKDGDLHKLVQYCFTVRTMTPFRVISRLAMESEAYRNLRHYIGRLGGHLKATRILVSAALATPALLDNFSIKLRRSSRTLASPLAPDRIDLNGIIGRAFHTEEDIAHYRGLISSMDRIFDGGLQRGIRDRCSFSTRVHAELLLVDLFQEHGFDFVADDRYIGCSKPACYCCYHYISALRGGFSLSMPACHNNLYLPWRAPDIPKSRGAAPVKMRENALNTMIVSVRADLKRQLDSQAPRRSSQFDSLTGVTSLRERELPGGRDIKLTFPERVDSHSDDESTDIRSRSCSLDSCEESREQLPTEHMVHAFQLSQDTTDLGQSFESSEDSDNGGVWLRQLL